MNILSENLSIGALASAADVNVETIRFYQRRQLLPEPERPYGSIRRYGQSAVDRVRFIKAAQAIGFSLAEIQQLLQLEDGTKCAPARAIAERKLADVRLRLTTLRRIESALAGLVRRCNAGQRPIRCPLIISFQQVQ